MGFVEPGAVMVQERHTQNRLAFALVKCGGLH
jgi:hypothetical protein